MKIILAIFYIISTLAVGIVFTYIKYLNTNYYDKMKEFEIAGLFGLIMMGIYTGIFMVMAMVVSIILI